MKNTTVLVVGVGLVGGLTGLALVAGRGAPAPQLDAPPPAPAPAAQRAAPSIPAPPPPGTVLGTPPPGAAMPQPPPGAVVGTSPQSSGSGAVMSKESSGAVRPGMTRSKGGMRVTAASTMMIPGAPDLAREDATAGMQTVLSGIAPCFEKLAEKVKQDVDARVSLELWGGKEGGRVRNAAITSLTPEDATVRTCVMEFLQGVTFRAPREGAMRLDLPVLFSMKDDIFGGMPPGAVMGGPPPGAIMGGPPPGAIMGGPPPQGP
jgi:hypothetical protein